MLQAGGPLTSRAFLVFPELINLKRPEIEDEQPLEDGVSYTVVGAVENVYASLVVLLGYTNNFRRTSQWRDQARYVVGPGLVCGFRVTGPHDGKLEFVLYFGADVDDPARQLFQGLFESFLGGRDLVVRRLKPVDCPNDHRLNRVVVRDRLRNGYGFTFCNDCGERVDLANAETPVRLRKESDTQLATERDTADARSRFEQALFRLNARITQDGIVPPECFISYAWGVSAHEQWVEQFAADLTKAGVRVLLDRWETDRVGVSVSRFVERSDAADLVIVVGTPLYRRKYDNHDAMGGFVAAAEGELIGKRLTGSEQLKQTVLPVLLAGDTTSFPPLVGTRTHADFRDPERYFATMLSLLLSVYAIDPRDATSAELRSLLSASRP